jgi:predicted RNase H-like HicB family nuclease
MRDDRARVSLDRHATYIVSAFVAGGVHFGSALLGWVSCVSRQSQFPFAGRAFSRTGGAQRLKPGEGSELTAAVTREGHWLVARCLGVEVTSQGRTTEGVLSNVNEAPARHFEDVTPENLEAPIIATVELSA